MGKLQETELKFLKGVGEQRFKSLVANLELRTFHDLLYYFPYRYVDRSHIYTISDLHGSDMPMVQIKGHFIRFSEEGEGAKKRLVGVFSDGKRMMEVVWFAGAKFITSTYKPGVEYVLFGKPAQYRNVWSMAHPEIDEYKPDAPPEGLQGIYSIPDIMRKKGFSSRFFKNIVGALLRHPAMDSIEETLPPSLLMKLNLMPLREALTNMHVPVSPEKLAKARERLKFEELFYLELNILRYALKRSMSSAGRVLKTIGENFNNFYSNVIPFDLTGAQKRVLREIRNDVRTGRQMNRLLQGDVGSGKTMVAFMTLLMAVDNGYQGCIMAPTEILAGQHYDSMKEWCDRLGLEIRLLTGSTRAGERREIHDGLISGRVNLVVGTHALLEEKVTFKNLAIAVIDEQHRFGVAQRARMWRKSEIPPHVLVMTATPIPRTLAMTVYGDLEVSVIDELPPGRKPVATWLRYDDNRMEVNRHIRNQLNEGRQIYIVYPLVKESEKIDLKSVEEGYERIMGLFPDVKVSIVHGKMKPDEKDHQMGMFVRGESRIMVATTVIEVGVNVPNASVMVIENAERFGLSQLHQLRGRVGRGADKSYCILMANHKMSADTRKRLEIMTQTTDGFLVSEADMKLRGPGDMEGTQQSGIAFNLKVADLARDGQILSLARREAKEILDNASKLSAEEKNIFSRELHSRFANVVDWSRIS